MSRLLSKSMMISSSIMLMLGFDHVHAFNTPTSGIKGIRRLQDQIFNNGPNLENKMVRHGNLSPLFLLSSSASDTKVASTEQVEEYDLIVVGSGNGACAFLSECMNHIPQNDFKILVLEQGQNFYDTSDVTHEKNWSKALSTGSIYKLHRAVTRSGRAILSGRAMTMGGGGSINYTMIHESSKWLSEHIGQSPEFWDKMKSELSNKLNRTSPFGAETPFVQNIMDKATNKTITKNNPYAFPNPSHYKAGNIPSLNDNWDEYDKPEAKQLYTFPTPFNEFGQRTNSGVSIVPWDDKRIHIKCLSEVKELHMTEGKSCDAVSVYNSGTKQPETYKVKPGGKVILCAGSQSPRLLTLAKGVTNNALGKHVKDHICMPLGIYFLPKNESKTVGPVDNYESIFGISLVRDDNGEILDVCNIDFFTGKTDRLIYLASSLYLAYLPNNLLKKLMGRVPILFTILSNSIRVLLNVVVFLVDGIVGILDVITFKGWGATELVLTTSLVKFSPKADGEYDLKSDKITLGFFEDEQDRYVAEKAIKENLSFLESLGAKPILPIRWIFQLLTKIPYKPDQVDRYVKNFSHNTLLSEQHLAGGCLFGEALDKGETDPSRTGLVFGTENIHVADLSTVPIPRVSTQMTAYVIGHYVGSQLFKSK